MAELKLVVGADVKEAEQALRGLVVSIDKTTASIQKFSTDVSAFGRAPLHNIQNISKAFLELKKDLSNVKFAAIPPIDADTQPAQQALKHLTEEVKRTALGVDVISTAVDRVSSDVNKSLGSLSTASLQNLTRAFTAFKQDLSNVKISALPPLSIDTVQARNTLQDFEAKVDSTLDGIRADLQNVKVAAIPAVDINTAPARESMKDLVSTVNQTVSTFRVIGPEVNKSFNSVVFNVEKTRTSFLALKADLSKVTIAPIPPVTLDIKPAQNSLKTLTANVDQAIDAVKADLTNIRVSELPPLNIDTSGARESLRVFVGGLDRTTDQVKDLSADINNALKVSAIPTVDANIAPAQNALRVLTEEVKKTTTSVSGISTFFDKFTTDVNKSLGALSVNSLENFKRAFIAFKQDLSNVKISALPPVTIDTTLAKQSLQSFAVNVDRTIAGVRADLQNVKVAAIPPVSIDTAPAERELKDLVSTVNTTVVSFRQIGSDINKSFGALPFNIEKFRQAFIDFKADLSDVKISQIPPVTIDTRPAETSLKNLTANVDKTVDAIKADLSNVKISTLPPIGVDVRPAQQSLRNLVDEAKVTGTSIAGISTDVERFSSSVRKSLSALPLHNVEAFRQAFLNFKADLSNITISKIPPLKVDIGAAQQSLQKIAQEADKTGVSVGNVSLAFQRFSQNIARDFGALPLSSIAAFRNAFIQFKSDLSNVKTSTIPPVKVDVSQASNALKSLDGIVEDSLGTLNTLSAAYQRWAAQADASSDVAANSLRDVNRALGSVEGTANKSFGAIVVNLNQTGAAVKQFGGELNQSIGTLPLQRVDELRKGILALKADLSSVKITAIPPVTANVQPAIQAIQTLTNESEKSGVAVSNVSSAYAKWANQVSQSSKQAVTAVKEVDITVETLRAKIAARKDLIVTERDLSKIAKYNREIEHLESVLSQVQNSGKAGFFGGKPLDVLTDKTNKTAAALTKLPTSTRSASQALINLGRIAQDAPFGFIAIQNNLTELLPSFRALRAEAGSTGKAMKLFFSSIAGVGGIGLGISILTSLITFFSMRTKQAKEETNAFADSIRNLTSSLGGDATKVTSLMRALSGTTLNPEEKRAALVELKEINKEYFGSLKEENGIIVGLQAAYDGYLKRLVAVGRTKAIESQLTKLFAKKLELELFIDPRFISATVDDIQKQVGTLKTELDKLGGALTPEELKRADFLTNQSLQKRAQLTKQIADLAKGANVAFLEKDFKKVNNELDLTNRQIKGLSELLQRVGEFDIKLPDPKKEGKTVDDFIARAKRLNEELEKIGFIAPVKFDFFDTLDEELAKAKKVFDDFNSKNLKINPKVFTFPSFSEPEIKEKVDRALDVVREGIRAGVIGLPKIPINVNVEFSEVTNFSQNTELVREFKERFATLSKILPNVDMELAAGLNRSVFVDAIRQYFKLSGSVAEQEVLRFGDLMEENIKQLNSVINGAVASVAVGGLANIGEAVGAALAGSDVGNAFKAFANIVADAVSAIGKQFITLGVTALLAKKALAQLFAQPALAIAAGVALIAVAAALRTALNKGVTGFAQGGLVFGPTVGLIGEGVGTSRSNPEVVAPLDQLKKMLGDAVGPGSLQVVVVGRLRGKDQILQNARTTKSQRRLG